MFAHVVLVLVCPEEDPETRIPVQVVLEVIPVHNRWGIRMSGREGKAARKGCFIRQVDTGATGAHSHWEPLGDSIGHTPQSHPTQGARELGY